VIWGGVLEFGDGVGVGDGVGDGAGESGVGVALGLVSSPPDTVELGSGAPSTTVLSPTVARTAKIPTMASTTTTATTMISRFRLRLPLPGSSPPGAAGGRSDGFAVVTCDQALPSQYRKRPGARAGSGYQPGVGTGSG
jgi:hypothetical protein